MRRKRQMKVKAFSILATFLMILSLIAPTMATAQAAQKNQSDKGTSVSVKESKTAQEKVSKRLQDAFKKDDTVTFLVKFKEKADTTAVAKQAKQDAKKHSLSADKAKFLQRSAVVSELKSVALETQANVVSFLESQEAAGAVESFHSYHIVNGIAVTATKEIAEQIAAFSEVDKILPNEERRLLGATITKEPTPKSTLENVEWNVERVQAPQVWSMGIDGSGTVVGSLDSGVQWDHPALMEKYRGYDSATGEVDHTYSFHDGFGAQDAPYDDHGHGTHVTGTMVGSEPDGSNQVGVAPGAKWIAAKVFNAAGSTTDQILLDAAEWMLAPGGRVDMAPDVVNNSWGGGPGLDEWYWDAVQAWRDAEIFPEFSAGNVDLFNPGGPGSVAVPANYPISFATGATDINDNLAGFSLRGPSPYDEIKPDISAPGVNIRSSVPGSGYEGGWNGTSMSGPAVSAVAALLRQVNANITVDEMEQVLINTAIPMTDDEYPETPNNGFGHGLVNAYDAVSSILDGLGTIEGQVTQEGEDDEAPTYEHTAPAETYAGMDLDLHIDVSDNISVTSVTLHYEQDGETVEVTANRISGDYKSGEYKATIPGDAIAEGSLTYYWTLNDFGNNEVQTDDYTVDVKPGITVGYFEDFETAPVGWTSYGDNDSWEWGVPESGPEAAFSGEKVYATNLSGDYASSMNASLLMPPVDLSDGNAYLQFKHWHDFEKYSSGFAYDFGYVYVSTDQEEWTQHLIVEGTSDGWEDAEVDLSEYSGERIYITFNATSDSSVTREGWYIDDVAISDSSLNLTSKAINKDQKRSVGMMAGLDMIPNKPAVNPALSVPAMPEKGEAAAEKDASLAQLPMAAKVSVLESGRSVNTNPQDGSYALMHATGTFTLKAEAYGFESAEQSVEVAADETSTANFTLQELPQGTIQGTVTDEATGEPVEDATLLLVEDANVTPVQTDADGNYQLTAYEGTYTLKISARGYHGQEAEVTVDGDVTVDFALEPFYMVPGGEIGYDDGTAENARAFYDAGNGWAVKMSLPEGKEEAVVTDGVFRFWDTEWPVPGGTDFQVEVWDATGTDGMPGNKLAGPIDATALRTGEWTVVDLSEHNIQVESDFYMVYIQTGINTSSPGLATDENGPNAGRSYQLVGGAWSASPADEGNYMIRARVAYGVDTPVITSPAEDYVTNEAAITVEGTASPTTTIELVNNDEVVGTAEIGDDGEFSIDTELAEGENTLVARSLIDGATTGESNAVTVTLDTIAPDLTIDNPKDGSKSNRETVTVEGTASDTHLDYVEVNGQRADLAEDGSYSKRILLDNGENVIEVTAYDLAGNSTTQSVTLDVQFDAPEIENLTPTEDVDLQAGESVKIEFDSEPGLRATYVIHMPLTNHGAKIANATELPMMETTPGHYVGYWTATSNAYAEGAVIEVIVKDSYGNEARAKAEGKLNINLE